MADRRFWVLASGTFACALLIGFVMQTFLNDHDDGAGRVSRASSDTVEVQLTAQAPVLADLESAQPSPDIVARNTADILIAPPKISTKPLSAGAPDIAPKQPVPEISQSEADPSPQQVASLSDAAEDPCKPALNAHAAENATVRLTISAPCHPNTALMVYHTGLSFSVTSGAQGEAEVTAPALADPAVFLVSSGDGDSALARADIPELGEWHRVALQWTGPAAFQIHAREFGARYGEAGHVWDGAPANAATGSFLTRLGDGTDRDARSVEIYSVPRQAADRDGVVALSVESEITVDTCGADIAAFVLQRQSEKGLQSKDFTLTMPSCSAIGDFLVLNNLLEDLKLASK